MKNKVYDKTFFDNSFSSARMSTYYNRHPGNERKTLQHYRQNIQLAEALLPSLSIYEVALRNSIIRELEQMTGRKRLVCILLRNPCPEGDIRSD